MEGSIRTKKEGRNCNRSQIKVKEVRGTYVGSRTLTDGGGGWGRFTYGRSTPVGEAHVKEKR